MGFSSKAVVIKMLYAQGVDTQSVIAMRMIFALPFALVVAIALALSKKLPPLSIKAFFAVSGLGILSYYVSSMLDFLGLQYVTASVERLILFTYPTLVLLISIFFYKKNMSNQQKKTLGFALGLTYLGLIIAFIAENGVGQQRDLTKGGLLVGACAITYALYVVWTGELVHRVGSARFAALAIIAATVPVVVQAYFHNRIDIFDFSAPVYWQAAWLVLGATVVPIFAITEGIRLVGASLSSIIGFVGPVFTIYLGYIFLGEQVSMLQLLGTSLVLVGIFLASGLGKKSA